MSLMASFEVEHQRDYRCLYYRQVSRVRSFEDACSGNFDPVIGVRQTLN